MTCDTWHVTCYMWHATCDMWHVVNILSKFQPYCLWFMILWRSGGKGWQTHWQGRHVGNRPSLMEFHHCTGPNPTPIANNYSLHLPQSVSDLTPDTQLLYCLQTLQILKLSIFHYFKTSKVESCQVPHWLALHKRITTPCQKKKNICITNFTFKLFVSMLKK